MTERWLTQLERLERLRPDDDLVDRARERPRPPCLPTARAGAQAPSWWPRS